MNKDEVLKKLQEVLDEHTRFDAEYNKGIKFAIRYALSWVSELEDTQNYEKNLKNLLAIIHRDGGHYTANNGIEKSVIDGISLIYKDRR